jgi:polar amino acid transport system substrate-binding protein
MKKTLAAIVLSLSAFGAHGAAAEDCGGIYTVQRGDSLSFIADRLYKNASLWRLILSQNIASIGEKPSNLRIGMKLELTCVDGLPVGLESGTMPGSNIPTAAKNPVPVPVVATPEARRLNILTANNFAPFVGKSLHKRGFLVDLVNTAMQAEELEEGHAIHWVDDRTAHMEPLLSNALLDAGFPWYKPNCEAFPGNASCLNYLFSEPLFETLRMVFTDASDPVDFENNAKIEGKTFCQVEGYDTAVLDAEGRNWLSEDKIELVYGETPTECLEMVLNQDADAVVLNEFTGRTTIKRMDVNDSIHVVPAPIQIDAFHMVVHKFHPEADKVMATINDGLEKIHDNGKYQAIVEDHMARIWADF